MIYSLQTLASLCLLCSTPFHRHSFVAAETHQGSVRTVAGIPSTGAGNGVGTSASFNSPQGACISSDGLFALVADTYNHIIRHIVIPTSSVATLAGHASSFGSTNGMGTNALFHLPRGVSLSPNGMFALVADTDNHQIRHIVISTSSVTTLAGNTEGSVNGLGMSALFSSPRGVSISPNSLYALVADTDNYLIRHIDIVTGTVTTLAGDVTGMIDSTDGLGTNAVFNLPTGVSISPNGLFALVADTNKHLIRHIVISTGSVTTLAGQKYSGNINGIGTTALFYFPYGISVSSNGMFALVADTYNHQIRSIDLSTTTVTTMAGTLNGDYGWENGIGINASFHYPYAISISSDNLLALVADTSNKQIRQISILTTSVVTTLAGIGIVGSIGSTNGLGTHAHFNSPTDVSVSSLSSHDPFALVTDSSNHLIRFIDLGTGYSVSTLAGVEGSHGSSNGLGTNAFFSYPTGVSLSSDGLFALVTDTENHLIRHIVISTASVTTLAGGGGGSSPGSSNGIGTYARFSSPYDIAISSNGLFALVADTNNNLIRQIDISTTVVMTFAGSYIGTAAIFDTPMSISISPNGVFALVADTEHSVIRRIEISTADISTLAGVVGSPGDTNGIGSHALFSYPFGVSISTDNLFALVGDASNNMIRYINISTGHVMTLAGDLQGSSGSVNGIGTNSQFDYPCGVSISSFGPPLFALIVDQKNNAIRRIDISSSSSSSGPPSPPPSSSPGRYSFGVLYGDHSILNRRDALFVHYFSSDTSGTVCPVLVSLVSSLVSLVLSLLSCLSCLFSCLSSLVSLVLSLLSLLLSLFSCLSSLVSLVLSLLSL
jgi:hypothetical protein